MVDSLQQTRKTPRSRGESCPVEVTHRGRGHSIFRGSVKTVLSLEGVLLIVRGFF